MPANLPPQYFEAEKKYRQAKTDDEKLRCLQQMLAIMPKHKGTDKLQADLRRRISKLKKLASQRKKSSKRAQVFKVEKEGAGQLVLVGPPNVGKSQILASLTNANPEIAPYPFTTQKPLPGMMPYDHIQIQLVDVPPISSDYMEYWVPGIVRNSDGVLLVVDLSSDDLIDQTEMVIKRLMDSKVSLGKEEKPIDHRDGIAHKKTLILANKNETDRAKGNLDFLKEFYNDRFPIFSFSAATKDNLSALKKTIYNLLGIIRVYTKEPSKKPDYSDPIILKKGDSLLDAALSIHKDFARDLKYARIWGKEKYDGQMVQKDYPLQDEDVVEFHI
jgi:ribosome-interacting GTPase 1